MDNTPQKSQEQSVSNEPLIDLSNNQSPAENVLQPEKKSNAVLFIVISLFVLALAFGFLYWYYSNVNSKIVENIKKISINLSNLEKNYKDIVNIYDRIPQAPNSSSANVLGVEEDLQIDTDRQLSDKIKNSLQIIKKVENSISEIEEMTSKNSLLKPLLPKFGNLIVDTNNFISETEPLLIYYDTANTITINSKMKGFEIGMAIQDAISRKADEQSLKNYKTKLRELSEIYNQIKAVNIDKIPEELKTEHEKALLNFDDETKVFREIENALEKKDGSLLMKALNSTVIQGTTAQNIFITTHKNFWSQNPIITEASALKSKWQELSGKY